VLSVPGFETVVRSPEREIDLALAALLIARVETPSLAAEPWLGRLDDLAARAGLAGARDAPTALARLRRFLFEDEGFRGNADEYFDPRNSCLDHVLQRRVGIPITLSVLMMEVGRRLGIAIDGIGLPGHFIVRDRMSGVLIDPFHGGAVLSVSDAEDVVAQALGQRTRLTEAHFTPVTKLQILMRMLANLKSVYVQRDEWPKALQVIDWLLLLEQSGTWQLRDRGTVLM
jgi:regulator of sirC expression with transglutaminase-like and TPR domain